MSIPNEVRQRSAAQLRRWYDLTGAEQLTLPHDGAGWRRHARCGPHNPNAPDPELFFPLSADSAQTYEAQAYCALCPVRRYCDADTPASRQGYGVRGGIYRDERGQPAALCVHPRCLNYRAAGWAYCGGHIAERAAERAARTAERAAADGAGREVVAA